MLNDVQETERFVLMDRIPQQAYGRMRMCRAMVNDHFTPAYLAAMTSAMVAFSDGYPALRSHQLTDAATAASSVSGGHDGASPAEPANGKDVLGITSGSAVGSREVTERGRRGRSRAAVPGTAKPRPPVNESERAAHSHAKDA
jgi:hypothetical protein